MEEQNDNIYHKAIVLMQGALKKYEEGEFEAAEKERQQANEAFDEIVANTPNNEEAELSTLYGENRNFGIIYNVFEANTKNLYKTKKGRKAMSQIVKLIKENKVLSTQFDIYNALNELRSDINECIGVNAYVTLLIQNLPTLSINEVKENNDKLISLLRKTGINEMVEISDELFNLYEAIEYVMFNKPGVKTLSDYLIAEDKIEKYLSNHIVNENKADKLTEKIFNENLLKLSSAYEYVLNEDEKKVIDTIAGKGSIKEAFDEYKNKLTQNVKKLLENNNNANELQVLNSLLENINGIKYSESNAVDDIVKMMKAYHKITEK